VGFFVNYEEGKSCRKARRKRRTTTTTTTTPRMKIGNALEVLL
jgi:hypothetical protein